MPYIMGKRAEAHAETRRAIMGSAMSEFLEKGYAAATLRGIASRANMSTGAIFASFSSKDDLWREVTGLITPEEWARNALGEAGK